MLDKHLVLIKVSAEGYYSGKVVTCAAIVEVSFYSHFKDDFNSVYFDELDGKHSEVKGDVTCEAVTKDNLKDVIEALHSSDGDDYVIWEQLLGGLSEEFSEIVDEQIELDREFFNRSKKETTVDYYFDGKVL